MTENHVICMKDLTWKKKCFQQTRGYNQREAISVFGLKVNEPDAKCE